MAVYKVIQDIESEDKLIGPLTLKGFIYAAIAGVLIFVDIRLAISGAPSLIKVLFIVLFLPPIFLFGTLASPLGREQPTETWLLSHIIFLFKPRTRHWDQNGMKQLVRVTVPKKVERILSKNFNQTEVNSRLSALANMLDSRGWAVKNVAINLNAQMPAAIEAGDERLAGATTLAQEEPVLDIHPADDILDEQNNPIAQNVSSMMQQAEVAKRLAVQQRMDDARTQASQPAQPAKEVIVPADLTPEEKTLLDKIHQENAALKMHPPIIRGGATVTGPEQTAKLELANSGSDLSVATISRLANRNSENPSGAAADG